MKRKEQHALLKKKRFWVDPNSRNRILVEIIHLILINYSAFALPIIASFDVKLHGFWLVMEIFCFIEGIIYSACQLRVAQYEFGILTLNLKVLLKYYWKRRMLFEILGQIPINLIFRKFKIIES